jgi:hypothetical protein
LPDDGGRVNRRARSTEAPRRRRSSPSHRADRRRSSDGSYHSERSRHAHVHPHWPGRSAAHEQKPCGRDVESGVAAPSLDQIRRGQDRPARNATTHAIRERTCSRTAESSNRSTAAPTSSRALAACRARRKRLALTD